MASKNRMKSTFMNNIQPGIYWICKVEHHTIKFTERISEGDILITIKKEIYNGYDCIQFYSQKKNSIVRLTAQDIYFYYDKM